MKRYLFIFLSSFWLLLSPAHPIGLSDGRSVDNIADSLCRQPLLLHFRFDRTLVEYDYMDNPRTLDEFRVLFSDTLCVSFIDTITITSYASPEGAVSYNARLAQRRAIAVKGYLIWKYPHLDQYRIVIRPQGEDWTGLRQLVKADASFPDRDDVLEILDKVSDTERCKVLLRRLNCGYAYKYINKNLLPKLRNAAVCMVRMKEKTAHPDELSPPMQAIHSESEMSFPNAGTRFAHGVTFYPVPDMALPPVPVTHARRPKPVLSLKTNLLTWTGLTSEGKIASLRPNLALELFFARCWSLSASGEYSHWQGGTNHKFWGISGYSLEPRFWLLGDGTYRWLYLGAYGLLGDFDYQPSHDGDSDRNGSSVTGTYWSAGLYLGLYFRLSRHWGLEAGLRGGYRDASGKAYDNEPPHAYYHHDFPSSHWGITGFNFSLTYRWWNKTIRR